MEMSQLDSDLRLPPRKRLLAGYMKLNGIGSSSSALASSSSASNSVGSSSSSSASTSRFHSVQNQSPEEHVEAARSAAASAVKAAKAARALANEKALISSKAIAAAKRALELVDSFPKEEKKHVSLDHSSSKGQLRYEETEDLARRLQRAIERRYPKVLATREDNGKINKKLKMNKTVAEGGSRVTGYMNGIAGVVDSDSSFDGLESSRKVPKAFKPDEVDSIPTPGKEKAEEQRRVRLKLKKFPLSLCDSTDQENGISSCVSTVKDLNKAIRS